MFVLFVYLFDNFELFSLIEPNIELYWKLVAFACIYIYLHWTGHSKEARAEELNLFARQIGTYLL